MLRNKEANFMLQGMGRRPVRSGKDAFTWVGTATLLVTNVRSCELCLSGDLQSGQKQTLGSWDNEEMQPLKSNPTQDGEGEIDGFNTPPSRSLLITMLPLQY